MTTAEYVLAGGAVFVALPATWWNRTGLALFASWLFGFVAWYRYDYALSYDQLVYCDLAVIAFIMAKPEIRNCRPYRGFWHWLQCRFLERSVGDRMIVLLFVPAWIAYSTPITEAQRWWAMWFVAMLQFAIAAGEAFYKRRLYRAANAAPPEHPSAGLKFARPAWGGGYG